MTSILNRELTMEGIMNRPLNQGEIELFYFIQGKSGSFSTNLFNLIASADGHNKQKLAQGFPNEVQAFINYQTVPGYWEYLQERMSRYGF